MAKLYITEYANLAHDGRGRQVAIGEEPGYDQVPVAIGAGSLQSAAFRRDTNFVRLHPDATCSIAFGSSPTATTSGRRLRADTTEYFGVKSVTMLAVIANT